MPLFNQCVPVQARHRDLTDQIKVDNLDVPLSTRASEETAKKTFVLWYDFAARRNAGRLLALIDFSINDQVSALQRMR